MTDLPPDPLAKLSGRDLRALLNRLREAEPDSEDLLQFLAFAMPLARRSRAQLFQDLWALWVSGQKRGGYFVEFGAADGERLSNTWLLEKELGWSGVLAEPNPDFHETLRAARGCAISTDCVYSRSGETLEFMAVKRGEFSRIASIRPGDPHEERRERGYRCLQVQTISLNDLLVEHQAPGRIDYLSIDTEGSEFEILSAFDFDRWDVRALSVEHNFTPMREELFGLLTGKGFARMWPELSAFDDWYVKTG